MSSVNKIFGLIGLRSSVRNGIHALNNRGNVSGHWRITMQNAQSNCLRSIYTSMTLFDETLVKMPSLSPTMSAGTIVKWHKKEGDKISAGDLLCEVQTDKAVMAFEFDDDGVLAKILIDENSSEVPVGALIAIVCGEGDDWKSVKVPSGDSLASSSPSSPQTSPAPESAKATAPKSADVAPTTKFTPVDPNLAHQYGKAGRIFASPLAKRLATEKGIDLSLLAGSGSGPSGRIRAHDVLSAPAFPQQAALGAAPLSATGAYKDISLTNMRQVIAKRLLMSKQTVPHYYLSVEIEVDELLKARNELNEMLKNDNVKISVNDFVVKAAALACQKVPEVNSSWQETFIRQFTSVDVSIAVSTDNGLITPIVFGAEKKGLVEIANDTKLLAKKARDGKLQPHEFQGGSFTISNLGMFGVSNFSAVINPPQSCILAIGTTERRLVPDAEGKPKAANILSVTLSCDHRVVDGAVGATWLKSFKQYLAKPFSMIL